MIVSVAVRLPGAAGVNVTFTVALPPAATVSGNFPVVKVNRAAWPH